MVKWREHGDGNVYSHRREGLIYLRLGRPDSSVEYRHFDLNACADGACKSEPERYHRMTGADFCDNSTLEIPADREEL